MTREEAKEIVKQGLEDYLEGKGINTKKPFLCLNPDHNERHASMSVDRRSRSGLHCHCFSCNAHYDTFDLIRIDYGLTDDAEIFKKGYELFGLKVDNTPTAAGVFGRVPEVSQNRTDTQIQIHNKTYSTRHYNICDLEDTEMFDFTAVLNKAHEDLLNNKQALGHYLDRGLSIDIIKEYKLGYAADGCNSLLKDWPQLQSNGVKTGLYKYIFPYVDTEGRLTYFLSEIIDRQQVDDYNSKYKKIKKGNTNIAAQIFNERYLQQGEKAPGLIFICEGIFDALSVEEVGGKAIAFAGTAHNRFLQLCKKYKPNTTFVIALDNDAAGQAATARVIEGLDFLNMPYVVKTAASGKDFNDDLKEDRESFKEYINQVMEEVKIEQQEQEQQEIEAYMQTSTAFYLQGFIDRIEKSKTATFYSTGFSSIDSILDGGIYPGLYCIGAISSLGKTTFCLQVIDNIAAAGNDVLIFSLEMAREELIAKSVSRHTLLEDMRQHNGTKHAKTTRGITTGTRYINYSQQDKLIIRDAIKAYSEYADNIYIHEGVGNIGVNEIRDTVEQHIKITGNKPILLIDYLQILAPYNDRATDKQNTDKAVLELKRISRDFSIPVIGISSFNRDNYTAPVNMASFKESGAVEYSSDVLIALQYGGMDWKEGETDKDRNKRIRDLMKEVIEHGKAGKPQSIQVKVLKNRNGSKGDTFIDFYPMFNYFTEQGKSGVGLNPAADSDNWTTISGTEQEELPFN